MKTKTMAAPAPEVDAKKLAAEWVKLKKGIGMLQKRLDEVVASLRAFVESTGEQTIGEVMAYEKANPAKIVNAKDEVDLALEKVLLEELKGTQAVKEKLDITWMKDNWQSAAVSKALQKTGANILVVKEIQFKHKP